MCDREKIGCREKMRGLMSRTGNRKATEGSGVPRARQPSSMPWSMAERCPARRIGCAMRVPRYRDRRTTVLYGLSIAPHVRSAGHLTI